MVDKLDFIHDGDTVSQFPNLTGLFGDVSPGPLGPAKPSCLRVGKGSVFFPQPAR